MSTTTDTISPHLTRYLIRQGVAIGVDRSKFAAAARLDALDADDIRIPTATILRVWEQLAVSIRDTGGSVRLMEQWRPGTLGVWDYLFTAADTLADALRDGARHFVAIGDPSDKVAVTRDEDGLTVSWDGPYGHHLSYPLIAEFVPTMFLAAASSGAGRPLTPVRVRLPHRAPPRHAHLIDAYGTREVDFDAPAPSITFAEADTEATLPRADPALASILADHARVAVATARPVLGWLDRFGSVLEHEFGSGTPELGRVAHRLALSPRTLQRRLRDEGTSWRRELERARQRRVEQLLRDTSLTVSAIAARVGYHDPRALRRAIHRWYGYGPARLRAAGEPPRPDPR